MADVWDEKESAEQTEHFVWMMVEQAVLIVGFIVLLISAIRFMAS